MQSFSEIPLKIKGIDNFSKAMTPLTPALKRSKYMAAISQIYSQRDVTFRVS